VTPEWANGKFGRNVQMNPIRHAQLPTMTD
jgi:hypothetical protein